MNLFIGSTTERQAVAREIAAAMSRRGMDVTRWWKVFESGDLTLDRLLEVVDRVDGAVFVLEPADAATVRGKPVRMPRDNLLFELGLFMHRLGRQRCYLLVEDGVKLPTDIAGLTYVPLVDDLDTVVDELAAHFERLGPTEKGPSFSNQVPLIADPKLLTIELGQLYEPGLRTRSLYLGTQGARCWLGVVNDNDYEFTTEKNEIKKAALALLHSNSLTVGSLISLGPGHGEIERYILLSAESRSCRHFIPIDLNALLLRLSIQKSPPHIRVPLGIQGDFEDGFDFFRAHVEPFVDSSTLFLMTGNTFGNLDRMETAFVHDLRRVMPVGSHWLLEATTLSAEAEHSDAPTLESEDESVLRLIVNGLVYHTGQEARQLRETIDEHLKLEVVDGLSDVQGTETIVYARKSGEPLAFCRRYSREALRKFLEDTLGGEVVAESVVPHSGSVDNCLLLVRKT